MEFKMKNINSILQMKSTKQNSDDFSIELLLRRGTTSTVFPPKLASEMICQDCGGNDGRSWSENGKKLWFCGNNKCLKTDTKSLNNESNRFGGKITN